MCHKTEGRSIFREISSRIRLHLASIAIVVVGYTLAAMAGGLLGAVVVGFTVWSAGRLLGDSVVDGPAIISRPHE